jgi:hypothetical protein
MQRKRHSFLARAAMTLLVAMITVSTARAEITGSGNYNDPYVLNTAEDWATFAEKINDGSYFDKYYKLSDTWDNSSSPVTVTVGTKDHPFNGSFNGNGKTLYVNINDTENEGTAPFREVTRLRASNGYSTAECDIKNLTVRGSVTGGAYAAGLVGISREEHGSIVHIDNCTVDVNVSVPGTNDNATMGGVIGLLNQGQLSLANTTFCGTLDNKSGFAGGLVGGCLWSNILKANNCLFKGSYKGSSTQGFHPVIVLINSNSKLYSSECNNCFYTEEPTLTDASHIIYSGTRVYASANDIDSDLLKKNLYGPVKASDNEQYYAPATVNGLGTIYKYTGSAIALDYTVNAFDGTELSKGTHYTVTLKRNGSVVSEVKEKGNYALAFTGVPGNTIEFSFGVVDADNVVNLGEITSATTIADGTTLTGTLTSNVKVSIAAGATVTLYNATINGINKSDYMFAGLTCEGDATLILAEGTTNKVTGFYQRYPAIQAAHNSGSGDEYTLTIRGEGSLIASTSTYSGWTGAAIGGSAEDEACGNIVIEGGNITANCGNNSAAIGGAFYKKCGDITISGGIINASASWQGCGIGSGSYTGSSCGNITISGGEITANGGSAGTGIGGGCSGVCGNILICGGTVTAESVDIHGVGIGCAGSKGVCGNITITQDAYCVSSTRGSYAKNSIGRDYNYEPSTIGTVTIGCTLDAQGNPVGGKVGEVSDESFKFYGSVATNVLNTVIISGIKDHYCYNGSSINIDYTLTDLNGNVLKQGTDYTVTLNGTDVTDQTTISVPDLGNYTLTFLGKGNYSGEQSVKIFVCDLTNITTDFTFVDGDVISGKFGSYKKISIADGATVTLNGMSIIGKDWSTCPWAALTCEGDATIILADGTENTLTTFQNGNPAIYVPEGKTLTIKGTGSLTADNSSRYYSPAIGGTYEGKCGNIVIESGNITALGGPRAAVIGCGLNGSCGDITISGGNITATKGSNSDYCIGGPNTGTITIGTQVTGSIKDNVTLYPYTVSFDANGGSGSAMPAQTFVHDIAQNLTANTYTAANPTDAFLGWSTSADGKLMFTDGGSAKNLTETPGANVTLYALWHPNVDESTGISVDNDFVYPAAGHFYVNMPATDSKTIDIPTTIQSFKVYDNGGKAANYSNNCAGTLVLNAPEGYVLQLSGNADMFSAIDYLSVYDGQDVNGTPLIDQKNELYSSIGLVTTKSQSMTLYFWSDDSRVKSGLDLTVRVIKANAENDVTVKNPADGGSVGINNTTAKVNDVITLMSKTSTGYVLSDLNVVDSYNNAVSTTDMLWYTGNTSATFTMPGSAVTVTPTYTNTLTADGGLYVNLPKTGTKTIDLSTFPAVKSFKVYDDGGKDGDYSSTCDGSLVLTAPEGCRLEVSGTTITYPFSYLNIYDGTSDQDTRLVRMDNSDDTPAKIGNTVISSGRSLTINLSAYKDASRTNAGIDLTVKVVAPDDENKISVKNPAEGGSIGSSNETAKLDETVTLTNKNAEGYFLSDISVVDSYDLPVKVDWQGSLFNTATFKMLCTDVTVTPTYTNDLTVDGGLFVKMPQTGVQTVDIPKGVQSFKLYDDGGPRNYYSNNCDGTLTLTAPEGYELQVTGTVRMYYSGRFSIYDGNDCNALKIFERTNSYDEVTIAPLVTSNRSMTFCLYSNGSSNAQGINLTVTLIDISAKKSIAINDATGGSLAASTNNTTVTEAAVNETVTLTVTLDDTYLLNGISVVDADNKAVNIEETYWYLDKTQASFRMPASAVTVTPSFTNAKTAEGGLFINMKSDETMDVTVPVGVQSFKVYDNGGKDGKHDKKNSAIVLTAPEGCAIQLTGTMTASYYSYLDVYNGTTTSDPLLAQIRAESGLDDGLSVGPNVISGRSMLINFRPSDWRDARAGLDLTVTIVDTSVEQDIAINNVMGGSLTASINGASVTNAKVNNIVTLTDKAEDGYCLTGISVMNADNQPVSIIGDVKWYNASNQVSFTMPNSSVTITPTYVDKVKADDNYFINMPTTGDVTVTIPTCAESFTVYDDGGKNDTYSDNCNGTLILKAPKDYSLWLKGSMYTRSGHTLSIYDVDGDSETKLFSGSDRNNIDIVGGSNVKVHFDSNSWHYVYHGYEFKVAVGHGIFVDKDIKNGKIVPDKCFAVKGSSEAITLNVEPAPGYSIGTVSYNDGTDHVLEPVNGVYSLTLSDKDVSVSATFTENVMELANNGTDNTSVIAQEDTKIMNSLTLSGRTLYKDGEWNTICLPFSMDEKQIAASPLAGVTIKEFDADKSNLTDGELTLNFTEATTIEAGKPYIVKWDKPADLVIKTEEDWKAFANGVSYGNEGYKDKLVRLDADIKVSKMVGDYYSPFRGTFDGNGHKLTVNLNYEKTAGSSESDHGVAPFRFTDGATIKNLTVDGIITTKTAKYAGGIIGIAKDYNNTIENCVSSVEIHSTVTKDDNDGTHGGLVGKSTGKLNIKNCMFNGMMTTDKNHPTSKCGGFVGWNNSTLNISNSLYAPAKLPEGKYPFSNTECATFARNGANITNSYYTEEFNDGTNFTGQGEAVGTLDNKTLLGNDYLGSAWMEKDNAVTPAMIHVINPEFKLVTIDNSAEAVSKMTQTSANGKVMFKGSYSAVTPSGKDAKLYDIHTSTQDALGAYVSAVKEGCIIDGYYSDDKKTVAATGINPDENGQQTLYVSSSFNPDHFAVNKDEYTIKTVTGWNAFCDALQENEKGYFTGKTVKLADDFSNETSPVTRMAAMDKHEFTGTFNGNGKTLAVSFGSAKDPIKDIAVAPFRAIDGSTIKDLHVSGDIYTAGQYAAGIVGIQYGQAAISNCRSSVNIHSYTEGKGKHGGFVGMNGTSSDVVVIEGCLFDGKMLSEGKTATTDCSGFVGEKGHVAMVSNSLYAPATTDKTEKWVGADADESATFVGNGDDKSITNSYYTRALGTEQGAEASVYTPAVKFTPQNVGGYKKHYSVSGIAAYDSGLKYDGKFYLVPATVTLANDAADKSVLVNNQVANVTLAKRTLYRDGDWNTICLPFDVTLKGSPLEGATVMKLNTDKSGLDNGVLTLTFEDEQETLYAGTPYIIKWDAGKSDIVEPVFQLVAINDEMRNAETSDQKVIFRGTYVKRTCTEEDKNILFLGAKNTLYYPQPGYDDAKKTDIYPSIGACRAFFQLVDYQWTVKEFQLRFNDEDVETSLNEELRVKSEESDAVYDLSGRKIANGQKPKANGIYIVGGKKIFIK